MGDRLLPAFVRALVEQGVTEDDLRRARFVSRKLGSSVGAALVARGSLSEAALTRALSSAYGLPAWDGTFDVDAANMAGETACFRDLVLPVARRAGRVVVASADPTKHDVLAAMAVATGTRAVDVVVAADSAIARALIDLFVWPDGDEDEAALESGPGAAPSTSTSSSPWSSASVAGDPIDRLSDAITTLLLRTHATHVRIEATKAPRIFVKVSDGSGVGRWAPAKLFDSHNLDARVVRAIAATIASRATLGTQLDAATGVFHLITQQALAHGGSCVSVDVLVEPVPTGVVLVMKRALVREYGGAEQGDLEKLREHDYVEAFAGGWDAGARGDLRVSMRELGRAAELAEALEGRGRYLASRIHAVKSDLLADAGRLEEAIVESQAFLRCTDVFEPHAVIGRLAFSNLLRARDELLRADTEAQAALEMALDLVGGPCPLAAHAKRQVAFCQLEKGDLDAASRTITTLTAWAELLDTEAKVHASHLRALLAREMEEHAKAAAELSFALGLVAELGPSDDRRTLHVELLVDLVDIEEARGMREEATLLLDRAKKVAKGLHDTHPLARAVIERANRIRATQPYR